MRPHAGDKCAWVALSGGVDSAVAASIALDEGLDVLGVTMRLGVNERVDDGAVRAAAEVAGTLGIPHRVIDLSGPFAELVVRPFIDAYLSGETPNPCVVCNDHIKFGLLLDAAVSEGADVLVTGHYARIDASQGHAVLLRGLDAGKDQSYFLYRLVGSRLQRLWFPLGGMRKPQVRDMALQRSLPSADRDESQDICFLSGTDVEGLLAEVGVRPKCGEIVGLDGEVLGTHDGIWRFTVGQRKGIGVGGGPPLYVVAIDAAQSRVVVGPAEACEAREVHAYNVVWDGPEGEQRVEAQIRYRAVPTLGTVDVRGTELTMRFDSAVSSIAHGQSLVCYEGDRVIGGGYLTGVS
ncbi:MAG: tRNA 2-thiouridine(34) synthase MnmA [Coriobacteriia bacterium]|nr:tRNA 2-thiouridine(34) synthase MnmA [Coriobacteriia bacterium]